MEPTACVELLTDEVLADDTSLLLSTVLLGVTLLGAALAVTLLDLLSVPATLGVEGELGVDVVLGVEGVLGAAASEVGAAGAGVSVVGLVVALEELLPVSPVLAAGLVMAGAASLCC